MNDKNQIFIDEVVEAKLQIKEFASDKWDDVTFSEEEIRGMEDRKIAELLIALVRCVNSQNKRIRTLEDINNNVKI